MKKKNYSSYIKASSLWFTEDLWTSDCPPSQTARQPTNLSDLSGGNSVQLQKLVWGDQFRVKSGSICIMSAWQETASMHVFRNWEEVQILRIYDEENRSCSGGSWCKKTVLRHFMLLFPLICHPSAGSKESGLFIWSWLRRYSMWVISTGEENHNVQYYNQIQKERRFWSFKGSEFNLICSISYLNVISEAQQQKISSKTEMFQWID